MQLAVAAEDVDQLDIEELMNREVTSVSRTSQKLFDSAAAVFVISQEDIRRSGVIELPEVLRLVPGLYVARLNANQWAITARGFNGQFANKLLVLIDGRTVYTPIFSGVYWESLDLPLEDVERIEVILGPGGSLWGANSVNGIINIITKNAADTQGGFASLTVGNNEKTIADLRYGSQIDERIFFRGYGKYAQRDGLVDAAGNDAEDDWDLARGGFRVDWLASSRDVVMVQGDVHSENIDRNFTVPSFTSPAGVERVLDNGDLSGFSLLGRWEHTSSLASRSTLQVYYQRERRDDLFTNYRLDTVDIDFQHESALGEHHELIWGLGYRFNRDDFTPTEVLTMTPAQREYPLFSTFIQDRIRKFDNRLELTFGAKIEHNRFTGWELQPNIRALWKPAANQRVWAAVSRAVRTPSRGDQDVTFDLIAVPPSPANPPTLVVLQGNPDLESETVIAYEIGYRLWPKENFYLDLTAFYNDYDDLRFAVLDQTAIVPGPGFITAPVVVVNGEKGTTYGLEIAADWRPAPGWRMQFGYSYLHANFELKIPDNAVIFPAGLGDQRDPRHQLSLLTSIDLTRDVDLDLWLRYVDAIPDVTVATPTTTVASVDDYLTLDVRLGWRLVDDLEFSIAGRNLLDSPHLEFLQENNTFPTQVERSVYGQIKWRF
ncbi:MAG: TonB-dependent receptor [Candidatus Competibacteraceae bacterium]|nr:TonB-dependent receptor [Candidatus Competibacteraceae bacterium]